MNDARPDRDWFGVRIVVGAILLGGAMHCESSNAVPTPKVAQASTRSEELEHERCGGDGERAETLDTNGDGKPDITKYYDGSGRELCRVVDLNGDGKPDLYEYFDAGGQIRRREFCYDDTGAVNVIELYDHGKLSQREYDISGRHRIDTWDWFDPGAPVDAKTGRPPHPARRERDTKGDGHVDQWWTWEGDRLTIAVDRDGSGRPDPATALVLSSDGGTPEALPANTAPAGGGGADARASAAATSSGGSRSDGGAP
ncbi:MAG TPA: hypothetical protein VEK07_16955 [Polyangiaceae bacterium]|nr:hypothetical protein [Polyangiaceae bacterium]